MVDDPLRTLPLLRAIQKSVRKNDTVLDIGTGLGILAIAAAQSGAREVFACDCDAAALAEAKRNAKKAGVAEKICFIESLSFDLTLSQRADLLICETVGSFAFDENILASIADAKRRLLKRGGRIIPEQLELWGAPIERHPKMQYPAEIAMVDPKALLASPKRLARIDFAEKFRNSLKVKECFHAHTDGTLRAFAVWPRVTWAKGEVTDASPLSQATHWKQGILPVEPHRVAKGSRLELELIIAPDPKEPNILTERLWKMWYTGTDGRIAIL